MERLELQRCEVWDNSVRVGSRPVLNFLPEGAGGLAWTIADSPSTASIQITPDSSALSSVYLKLDASNDPVSGQLQLDAGALISAGSAASPSLAFTAETGTGIFRPGATLWGIAVSGTERIRVGTAGLRVEVGGVSGDATARVHVDGSGGTDGHIMARHASGTVEMRMKSNPASPCIFYFGNTTNANRGSFQYWNSDDSLRWEAAAGERLRLTSTGLRIEPGGVTAGASYPLDVYASSGGINYARISNYSTGGCRLWLFANSATGDPGLLWGTSTTYWIGGIDNSDSDAWVLCQNLDIGSTGQMLRITTGGNAFFSTALTIGDLTTTPTYALEVIGAARIRPDLSWSTGDTATLWFGDTSHFVQMPYDSRGKIQSYYGLELANTTKTVVTIDNNSLVTFSDEIQVASYLVANLPTGAAAQVAYASNGRKAGEGVGAGTGVLVFHDGTNWIAVDTGAAVAA